METFTTREMLDRWNAGDESVLDTVRAIVSRYRSTEMVVEREYQDRRVAAFEAMQVPSAPGPGAASAAYRAVMVEQVATFTARVADIYDDYPKAYAVLREITSAESRAQLADTIALTARIAYGDGEI